MSFTWSDGREPPHRPIAAWQWGLVVLRGAALSVILGTGVVLTAMLRVFERPFFGPDRPMTPFVTVAVCRLCLGVIGLRVECEGTIDPHRGAVVANHASWLDIFVLNARKRVYFVSKSEVAAWPGIGLLARITGTLFIARDPKQARMQLDQFAQRLVAGHKLLFFPEGTSTDGMRVIPFKTTLFQSFFGDDLRGRMTIQPVTVLYVAPGACDPRFYGWWGEMSFGAHLLQILAVTRQGRVKIVYHPSVKVEEFEDRKALAKTLEDIVRSGMPPERRRG